MYENYKTIDDLLKKAALESDESIWGQIEEEIITSAEYNVSPKTVEDEDTNSKGKHFQLFYTIIEVEVTTKISKSLYVQLLLLFDDQQYINAMIQVIIEELSFFDKYNNVPYNKKVQYELTEKPQLEFEQSTDDYVTVKYTAKFQEGVPDATPLNR